MAKAKPKKAAKQKPAAKPKTKPKAKSAKENGPLLAAGPGKPLIVRSLDGTGRPVKSCVAIEWDAGFPTGSSPGGPITTVTGVADSTGPSFTLDNFNFTGLTILNIGFFSTSSTAGLGNSGILQITLTNPPSGMTNPVRIAVDYIDDDDLP